MGGVNEDIAQLAMRWARIMCHLVGDDVRSSCRQGSAPVLEARGDAQLLIPRVALSRRTQRPYCGEQRIRSASANDIERSDSVPLRRMSTPEIFRWRLLVWHHV